MILPPRVAPIWWGRLFASLGFRKTKLTKW
jgi:hypothetical protein